MNALVIYFNSDDEICINYAREFADRVYILNVTENEFDKENLLKSTGNILEDIEKYENLFGVIVLRKRENIKIKNFEFGNMIKKLEKYKLLVVE